MIIEDPNDPQKYLYDVDNGEKDIEGPAYRAEIPCRRHCYHSRGLVSLSFVEFSRDPVSAVASIGNRVGDYFHSNFNSTLINGKGRYPGGPATALAVVNVEQGKRSVFYSILCLSIS